MIKKLPILFFIFLITNTIQAQKKRIRISGTVLDSISIVKNAHIINLKTKQGTFSSDAGTFEIFAMIGDSLKITSVQHKTGIAIVSGISIKDKKINIYLKSLVYQLDEFELKTHDLIGVLGIDQKKVTIDSRVGLLKKTMDFSKIDMSIVEADDYIDKRVRPPINNVDPTSKFAGAGSAVTIPFGHSKRYWEMIRELKYKNSFPYKILLDLGENFFYGKLKIPKENYHHFLEYCNPLGIEDLYKKGKLLEVIKMLQKESKSYLEIIKKK